MNKITILLCLMSLLTACSNNELVEKGFPVSTSSTANTAEQIEGIRNDTLSFATRPSNILLTKNAAHRLTPIFKVNFHPKTEKPFTGTVGVHRNYDRAGDQLGNRWNNNFMPGFSAVYGYNFVNLSHYNLEAQTTNLFFEKPVLIKTLYYPAFSRDTLNGVAISRNYYLISCYDEDTNRDGYISLRDLRRFYYFDINGKEQGALVPKNYAVRSSEYDSANDYMYVFAQLDENKNGQMEYEEPIHIFWIDLSAPERVGRQY